MGLLVRQMTSEDIPAGMELKAFAHWNQTETDWRIFLEAGGGGCFAAVCDGRLVGTITVIHHGRSLAWIGMVLVHRRYRGRGIATCLMRKALDHLADCPTIKLDATAAGKKVYEKLGFVEQSTVRRLTTTCLPRIEGSTDGIAPITQAEFEPILRMDRRHFRGDRALLLAALLKNAPQMALRLTCHGQTTAYCFGRRGSDFVHIGPILAENTEDAVRLGSDALQHWTGAAVVLDVPGIHTEFLQWLKNAGFSVQREFARMVLGEKDQEDTMKHQFAVCGPEFG
ncbi:MAG: GNAT family N-acetyltransferase [Thermoguttaceae bacterium]